MNALVPLPVLMPVLAAGVKILIGPRRPVLKRAISIVALAAVLGVAIMLLVRADRYGPQVTRLGGWPAPVGITLVADRLSAVMLAVSSAVTLCVMVYAFGQDVAERDRDTPLSVFHPSYLLLTAGVCDAFLAGDLFNMFVGFEMMLMASYVLVTLGGTMARVRAGTTYIIVALLSSMLFLVAIAVLYAATGTVNMAQLSWRIAELPGPVARIAEVTLLTAFAVKAAVFPLSMWLPDSYPSAPTPVSAVFAGLLTKIGVYGVIRAETLLFPGGHLRRVLLVAALLSMLAGVLGALVQIDVRRLLSFTLVSHIGYMIFGVALDSAAGLAATVFYVLHHITIQTTLFLVAGLIDRRGGATSLARLGGLARTAPLVGVLFFVPAMNLGGIPPLSGFLGKLGLLRAGLAQGGPLVDALVAGAAVTSLLTLYSLVKVWNQAFWSAPPDDLPQGDLAQGDPPQSARAARLPAAMVAGSAALVVLSLAYTAAGGPLYALCERAAAELLNPQTYTRAVFPSGGAT
ncbi:Na+/H+ antiporter subunit D [Actinomadura nitritigenes]|uniref:Na+/H+ antiporter subunit D n=1 Tax=Actinomadura nitritigenes TaxID=134602 RepID=UPI003D8D7BD1